MKTRIWKTIKNYFVQEVPSSFPFCEFDEYSGVCNECEEKEQYFWETLPINNSTEEKELIYK